MKSWNDLEPDEYAIVPVHFTPGRGGNKINKVVIHHNGGNLSIQQCYNVWLTRQASAHYQVDANGRIGQLVHDVDTAWHAGDFGANQTSIGIEHADISSSPWRVSDATLDNGAHLVAAICKRYGLGRPQWGVNVFPHRQFSSTECPASLAGDQNAAYMAKAQAYYDQMTGATSTGTATVKPAAATTKKYRDIKALQTAVKAAADNVAGPDTRKRIDAVRKASRWGGVKFPYGVAYTQNVVGTTADGVWGANSRKAHDNTVAAIQRAVGANPDSIWGSETETKTNAALAAAEQP